MLEVTSVGFHCLEPQSVGESGEKAMAITLEVGVIEALTRPSTNGLPQLKS